MLGSLLGCIHRRSPQRCRRWLRLLFRASFCRARLAGGAASFIEVTRKVVHVLSNGGCHPVSQPATCPPPPRRCLTLPLPPAACCPPAGEGKKGNKEERRAATTDAPVIRSKKSYDFSDEKLVFESREF